MTASLYGIHHSNRNFSDPFYWGKNQFNSSFPVALCCYMRDKGLDANYIRLGPGLEVEQSHVSFDVVFNTEKPNEDLYFSFESRYPPYSPLLHDELKPIDLVVKTKGTGEWLRPLEIKLTTLPDSTTCTLDEAEYGCELVVRNPTTRYLALSIVDACSSELRGIREHLEPACHKQGAF